MHKARQVFLRYFYPGELLLARYWIAHQGGHIQAEVANEGEWVGWIHRQGRKHRKDRGAEIVV